MAARPGPRDWPSPTEWLAMGAGLVVFGYAGWDGAMWDPRWQLLLHVLALGAVGGLLAIAWRGGELPRTRIDLPILGLLAAYALATASAENHGLALRALASVIGVAAMLPVALVALRRRPAALALVVIVPTLLLAAGGVAVQIWRRVEWVLAGGPGPLPPVRLPAEGTAFGSVAVAAFVVVAIAPLALLVPPGRVRSAIWMGLVVVGVPAILLSGSRSAWLALAVIVPALAVSFAWRSRWRPRLPSRWGAGHVALAGAVVIGAALAVAFIAPRLTAVTSLVYRTNLWRDTLAAWSSDPLLGIGPGTMPYARQAAAEALSFPVRQPHSHNLPLGVLGDAGVVGLLMAAVLVGAFAVLAGPWRCRTPVGIAAASVLAGFAVGGLFEDLTFLPNFNLLVVILAAIALTDAGQVEWVRARPQALFRRRPAALGVGAAAAGAVVLLAAIVTGDAAAIAYRAGTDAAGAGEWQAATRWLVRATELDPWHPAGPKALAVAADAAGQQALARRAAERAVELNAGDGASWTNLSLLCLDEGDVTCADAAATSALAAATVNGREAVNVALVREELGDPAAADEAYRLSILINRFTTLATDWPRPIELAGERVDELDDVGAELNLLLGLDAMGDPIEPARFETPPIRALAAVIAGDRPTGEAAAAAAIDADPTLPLAWEAAIAVNRRWDEPVDDLLRVYAVVRGAPPPARAGESRDPGGLFHDIASFRAYPIDGFLLDAEHLAQSRPFPWAAGDQSPPSGRR